ncbi:MAG TPA: OsmC family protein [Gemmatimonadaceae bacterium]
MNTPTLVARWAGEHRFDTGRADGPMSRLDGSGETGQSPVDGMLSALAACSGIDVVDILGKRRTPVQRLEVETSAVRRDTPPRRVLSVRLTYRIDGEGIEAVHAERAVALAFEKYCSVAATFKADVDVETVVVVNGAEGAPVKQAIPA